MNLKPKPQPAMRRRKINTGNASRTFPLESWAIQYPAGVCRQRNAPAPPNKTASRYSPRICLTRSLTPPRENAAAAIAGPAMT